MNPSSIFAAVAFFALFFAPQSHAAPGDLDPSFHALGHVTTLVGSGDDQGKAVAVQSDGKIVVALLRTRAMGNWTRLSMEREK